MKKILTLILFASAVTSVCQTTFNYNNDFKKILERTKKGSDDLSYDKLLKRFTSNDTSLTDYEVLSLLIGYTAKPEYKPYQDIDTEREIYQLNGEEKFKEGLELGKKFNKAHPLNVKTLFEIGYSFYKLNQIDSANYYVYQGKRIFKAMSFSGDGKTKETPAFSLGPADGQDYIRKFVGAKIGIMGSARDENGNFLDILEANFKDGKITRFYFIIQHATNKMFSK